MRIVDETSLSRFYVVTAEKLRMWCMAKNLIRIGNVEVMSVGDAAIEHLLALDHIFPM